MSKVPDLSGFDLGYPPLLPSWYGLWSPLLDCFLWVGHDLQKMKKTQALTVPKILTVLVQLDPVLYQQNIIDNTCAVDWTLQDSEAINFTLVFKKNFHDYLATDLQPARPQFRDSALLIQRWFSLTWNCLGYLENHTKGIDKDIVDVVFDLDRDPITKDMYEILLLEPDPDRALDRIKFLLENHV